MNDPLCTILITSYNKADFIAATIESALGQDYPHIQVVVVDDGSRDASVSVINRYQSRVTLLTKANGGQASALNVGFKVAQGSIVFLLDSDDTLLSDTVSRVVAMWKEGMSKVHFRLQRMREDGTPVPGIFLPPYGPLPSGDVTPLLRSFGFYPSSPTSGNAFSWACLNAIMPIEEELYRSCADTVLIGMAPLYGEIGALDSIGGYWRHTGRNNSQGGLPVLEAMLRCEHGMVAAVRDKLKVPDRSPQYCGRWPQHLKNRIIVSKFGSIDELGGARLRSLVSSYIRTVTRWPEYRLATRVKFVVWAMMMWLLPRQILRWIPNIAGPSITVSS